MKYALYLSILMTIIPLVIGGAAQGDRYVPPVRADEDPASLETYPPYNHKWTRYPRDDGLHLVLCAYGLDSCTKLCGLPEEQRDPLVNQACHLHCFNDPSMIICQRNTHLRNHIGCIRDVDCRRTCETNWVDCIQLCWGRSEFPKCTREIVEFYIPQYASRTGVE